MGSAAAAAAAAVEPVSIIVWLGIIFILPLVMVVYRFGSILLQYFSLPMIFFGLAIFIFILFCLENICNNYSDNDEPLDA